MTVRREMPDMGCYEAILPYISGTGILSQALLSNCKKDRVRQNLLRVLGKDTHHARRTPYQRAFNALAK